MLPSALLKVCVCVGGELKIPLALETKSGKTHLYYLHISYNAYVQMADIKT